MFKGQENIDFKKTTRGVYGIYNEVTEKWYIGVTRDLKSRIFGHLASLRSGRHQNYQLQHDFNIYSEENFSVKVLFTVSMDKADLLRKVEGYFINNIGKVYNFKRRKSAFINESDFKLWAE